MQVIVTVQRHFVVHNSRLHKKPFSGKTPANRTGHVSGGHGRLRYVKTIILSLDQDVNAFGPVAKCDLYNSFISNST